MAQAFVDAQLRSKFDNNSSEEIDVTPIKSVVEPAAREFVRKQLERHPNASPEAILKKCVEHVRDKVLKTYLSEKGDYKVVVSGFVKSIFGEGIVSAHQFLWNSESDRTFSICIDTDDLTIVVTIYLIRIESSSGESSSEEDSDKENDEIGQLRLETPSPTEKEEGELSD